MSLISPPNFSLNEIPRSLNETTRSINEWHILVKWDDFLDTNFQVVQLDTNCTNLHKLIMNLTRIFHVVQLDTNCTKLHKLIMNLTRIARSCTDWLLQGCDKTFELYIVNHFGI